GHDAVITGGAVVFGVVGFGERAVLPVDEGPSGVGDASGGRARRRKSRRDRGAAGACSGREPGGARRGDRFWLRCAVRTGGQAGLETAAQVVAHRFVEPGGGFELVEGGLDRFASGGAIGPL